MDNEKQGSHAIVGIVSKTIGVFAGAAMVTGKKVESWVKSKLGTEAGRSTQLKKKPKQVREKVAAGASIGKPGEAASEAQVGAKKKATTRRKKATTATKKATTRKKKVKEKKVKRGTQEEE